MLGSRCPERIRAVVCTSRKADLQVWKNGEKVDELVGAAKDRLKELVERHASVPVAA